jgi:hypothetical protein
MENNYGQEKLKQGKTCKGCEDTDWCIECEECEQLVFGDTNATGENFKIIKDYNL